LDCAVNYKDTACGHLPRLSNVPLNDEAANGMHVTPTRCSRHASSSTSIQPTLCSCRPQSSQRSRKPCTSVIQPVAAAAAVHHPTPAEQQQPLPIQQQVWSRLQKQHESVQLPHGVQPQQLPRHVAVSACAAAGSTLGLGNSILHVPARPHKSTCLYLYSDSICATELKTSCVPCVWGLADYHGWQQQMGYTAGAASFCGP
jgi:hypothetical protein